MHLGIPFRPKLFETLGHYSGALFRRDFRAGLNVMIMAFPLSVAFAIASGAKPEQGLFTAIIAGGLVAALSGSNVQIGEPTGAFVVITYSILQRFGPDGLVVCTVLAGAMLCAMGFAGLGSVIRFIPYPVSRAFTKGIAILILSSQIKNFLGLHVEKLPVDFVGKMKVLVTHLDAVHGPTVALGLASLVVIGAWPKQLSRYVPGSNIAASLARARDILGLPPEQNSDPLHRERQQLEAARRELTGALERANEALQAPVERNRGLSPAKPANTLVSGNNMPANGNGLVTS